MTEPSRVFVDTGAWIALAERRDPYHERAVRGYAQLQESGARLATSTFVVLETFTFLHRRGSRELALAWREAFMRTPRLTTLDVGRDVMDAAFSYFDRRELFKLSLVDATSFVLMQRHKIHWAMAFDTHFAIAGFRLVD